MDGWRRLWRSAADVPSRRRVLAGWAAAAGGELRDLAVCLPSGLPRRLARAEMVANAGCVGLAVVEGLEGLCARCPNPAVPGGTLCGHCRWLAGYGRRRTP